MKIRITLVAIALTGLLAGIAFAGPLVLSEINVRPYIHHVQGPTAEFEIEFVFANLTVLEIESEEDDFSINYQVWLNVTNPYDLGATLNHVTFTAAEQITPFSGPPLFGNNSSGGWGWKEKGVMLDGKWYNLTWVNGSYPTIDRDGNLEPSPFDVPEQTAYWMEGVQLMQRHVNGTVVATYLNMNGTWTDVTGRLEIEIPEQHGYSVKHSLTNQMRIYQKKVPGVSVKPFNNETDDSDTLKVGMCNVYVPSGEGYFDSYWKPGQSRLVLIEGTQPFGFMAQYFDPIFVLDSGSVCLKASTFNHADNDFGRVNNTVQDTWSYAYELKSVELTKVNNSYVYNVELLDGYFFAVDEWRAEVFLNPR